MKQVTLNIPENKYNFFIELVSSLDFVKSSDFDILEEHKNIVRNRIKASEDNPDLLLDWEDVKSEFRL